MSALRLFFHAGIIGLAGLPLNVLRNRGGIQMLKITNKAHVLPTCVGSNSNHIQLRTIPILKNPRQAIRFLSYIRNFSSFHFLIVLTDVLTCLQFRWWGPFGAIIAHAYTSSAKKQLDSYDLCKAMAYGIRGLKLYLAELLLLSLSLYVENKRQVSAVWSLHHQVTAGW